MALIKNRQISSDDTTLLAADADLASLPQGKLIVPATVWLQNKATLDSAEVVGIALAGDDSLDAIASDLDRFEIVALSFPAFRDGRGYSMARQLRHKHGYQGEIRAIGEVLQDQLYYMERVGFNSFVLPSDRDAEEALKAFSEFNVQYQASSDQPLPLYRRRCAC